MKMEKWKDLYKISEMEGSLQDIRKLSDKKVKDRKASMNEATTEQEDAQKDRNTEEQKVGGKTT